MTDDVPALARKAWAAMLHEPGLLSKVFGDDPGPMPAAVALDMVQDECDTREEAREALFAVAANWLKERIPRDPDVTGNNQLSCRSAAAFLYAELVAHAEACVEEVASAVVFPDPRPPAGMFLVHDYWLWVQKARRVVRLCRELEAA